MARIVPLSRALRWVCATALGLALAAPAIADSDKRLTLVVGFPAGGTLDMVARLVAEGLHTRLGRPVIVENRPGAGGIIATERVKNAAPDGDTLFVSTVTAFTLYPLTAEKLTYKPADFVPVVHLARFEYALGVNSKVPAATVRDYVSLIKRDPMYGFYGAPGLAGPPHFYGKAFARKLGISMTPVPYAGTAPLMQDFEGGQIPSAILPLAEFAKLTTTGKAKLLATTGSKRARDFPNVPTFVEAGVPVSEYGQYAIFAPAATPSAALAPVVQAVQQILQSTEARARLATMYMEPTGQSGAQLQKVVDQSASFWRSTVGAAASASSGTP